MKYRRVIAPGMNHVGLRSSGLDWRKVQDVFSRYCRLGAVKSKSARHMKIAFEEIFAEAGDSRTPKFIRSDRGPNSQTPR